MAKHRGTVYSVVRSVRADDSEETLLVNSTVIGVFLTAERADEVKAGSEQRMKEYGFDEFQFEVQASTYYDE